MLKACHQNFTVCWRLTRKLILVKLNKNIVLYGDPSFRGPCPTENAEQITFFSRIRKQYPTTYGLIAVHIRNEGKKTWTQAAFHRASGQTKGASDIIIPGAPTFVCELKRRDHTRSKWQPGQEVYLQAAQAAGAFVCVALGVDAAIDALELWLSK